MPERIARCGREFFAKPADQLARLLLGCTLVRTLHGARLSARIIETEAYMGIADKACHSFAGRRTPRVEPMYGAPGTAYVYFTYGMHHCFNLVCGAVDEPVAVLIRAAEPVEGLNTMREHRSTRPSSAGKRIATKRSPADHDLCRGPANLCRALALTTSHCGVDLCHSPALWIEPGPLTPAEHAYLLATPRIGIDRAEEWVLAPLRFVVASSACASGPKVSGAALGTIPQMTPRPARRTQKSP